MRRVEPGVPYPLFDAQGTRAIEQHAQRQLAPYALVQRAGLSVARLALALAPHAQTIWIAAGPGNNGADGIEAGLHLHRWGKCVVISWLGAAATAGPESAGAWQRARDAGVTFAPQPPAQFDFCVDALLGIGATRAPAGEMALWIARMNQNKAPVLAVDLPTGLVADTGEMAEFCVRASATLSVLTLKPGLFTADGRDACGQIWFDPLDEETQGTTPQPAVPVAILADLPQAGQRAHASHKGSYGDVAIVGGAPGMAGAAVLAGSAALYCGAGRVFVALLDQPMRSVDAGQPELMLRAVEQLDLHAMVVVCGCGGADAIRAHLPRILSVAARLVLDADALNAIAGDVQLQTQLRLRANRSWQTVLTPHPLEAARLLGTTSADVQRDRLAAATRLAQAFMCTVVLKGSGTIIAHPAQTPVVNPTGNARLATAGTGDVLAGAIGASLAAGLPDFRAACEAAYLHGWAADRWPQDRALTASELAKAMHHPA